MSSHLLFLEIDDVVGNACLFVSLARPVSVFFDTGWRLWILATWMDGLEFFTGVLVGVGGVPEYLMAYGAKRRLFLKDYKREKKRRFMQRPL